MCTLGAYGCTPKSCIPASGLAQALLNGCKVVVKEWDNDRDRWAVEINGKGILVKAGNTFAYDGLVAKWAIIEQELRSD